MVQRERKVDLKIGPATSDCMRMHCCYVSGIKPKLLRPSGIAKVLGQTLPGQLGKFYRRRKRIYDSWEGVIGFRVPWSL